VKRIMVMAIALSLLAAQTAFAGPGGGTSGFSGGGGGGGGGGFSGGGSSGGSGTGRTGSGVTFLIFVGLFLLLLITLTIVGRVQARKYRKRRQARERSIELAAAEAADDDEDFAVETVKAEAGQLFTEIYRAWSDRDRPALAAALGEDLMVEWGRRLDDFDRKGWHNICEVKKGPDVEYLGLVNRAEDTEDRVTVRITSTTVDYVKDRNGNKITRNDATTTITRQSEYWTLGKRGEAWILLSIQSDPEGRHILDSDIVATPWGDDQRLRDESITELATAETVENPSEYADLDFDGTARAAALDLAMVDGRFAPDVLEAAVRRAVDAWSEAVDGDDAPLEAIATPTAVQELLYPNGERTRLVVRGPRLKQLRITALHADATPPAMSVEADLSGRRYLENRDTAAVLGGSKERETTFTERWTMTLDGDEATPWRIAAALGDAAGRT
jgi:predicted lipid-binding transport protein (Tim44 family)